MTPRAAERATRPRLYLTPADQGRELSLDEFLSAGAEKGHRYELIRGRLVVSPMPDLLHDDIAEWIVETLRAYARAHPEVINRVKGPGRIFTPAVEADPPSSSDSEAPSAPEPDIVCFRGFPSGQPLSLRNWRDLVPVLLIEILSPDNPDKDRVRNVGLYLRLDSVREYWIFDPLDNPDEPTLTVYRRRGRQWQKPIVVPFGETYTTRLLPGLALLIDPRTYDA